MARITDHIERALARLLFQFRDSTNLKAIISGAAGRWQTVEDVQGDIVDDFTLADAEGDNLDVFGDLVDESRRGRGDTEYRAMIRVKIVSLFSNGEPWRLTQVYKALMGADRVRYVERYPATFELDAENSTATTSEEPAIVEAMRSVKPGGVKMVLSRSRGDSAFAFAGSLNGGGFYNSTTGAGGKLARTLNEA